MSSQVTSVRRRRRPYGSKKRPKKFTGIRRQEKRSHDQPRELTVVSSGEGEPSAMERPTAVSRGELISTSVLIPPSVEPSRGGESSGEGLIPSLIEEEPSVTEVTGIVSTGGEGDASSIYHRPYLL